MSTRTRNNLTGLFIGVMIAAAAVVWLNTLTVPA
jgi:hypothetical protein